MAKVTIGISLDLDDIEIIDEVGRKYHQKSRAQSVHTIIKQFQMLAGERQKQQELNKKSPGKLLINPQCLG